MKPAISIQPTEKKYSVQMRAVIMVLEADHHLMSSVKPFINFDTETIYWDQILSISFGSGHRAAITWLYGIWTDEERPRSNCFDAALNMSPNLQVAVLKALALRWGLS